MLVPSYDQDIGVTDESKLHSPRVASSRRPPHELEQDPSQTTQTLAEAMNTLRSYHNTGRGWTPLYGWASATRVIDETHVFQGDDIGNYDQRIQWIYRMADTLVEARFDNGAAYVANFNRSLLGNT